MKRFFIVLSLISLVFALVLLSSCSSFEQKEIGSDVSLDENTIEVENGKTIEDYSAKENLYLAANVLKKAGSFRTETTGKSVSLGIPNDVIARRIVYGGSVFKESRSYSSFVSLATQTFVFKGNYLSRDKKSMSSISKVSWSDTVNDIGKAEYLRRYGSVPSGVCGYVLNDDSIVSASLISKTSGNYTFRYELDNDVSTYYIKREMAYSAGVNKLPVFEKIVLTVCMDKDWKLISIDYDGQYKVAKLGGVTCNETLTEKFYDIGFVSDYPERALFMQYCEVTEEGETETDESFEETDEYEEDETEESPFAMLTDLIDEDFSLDLKVKISGVDEIESTVFDAFDLSYRDGKIYAAISDVKICGEPSAFISLFNGIAGVLPSAVELPEIDFSDLSSLTGAIKNLEYAETETEIKLKISLDLLGGAELYACLVRGETLSLNAISADFAGVKIEAVASKRISYENAVDISLISDSLPTLAETLLSGKIDLSGRINGATQIENTIFDDFVLSLTGDTIHAGMAGVKVYGTAEEFIDLAADVKDDVTEYFGVDLSGVDFDEIKNSLSDYSEALKKIDSVSCRVAGDCVAADVAFGEAGVTAVIGKNGLSEVYADFGGITVQAYPCANYDYSGEIPVETLADEYIRPLEELLSGRIYDFSLSGNVGGENNTAISGRVRVNALKEVYAKGELTIGSEAKKLTAEYLGGNIYAEYDGLKLKFTTDNFVAAADDIIKFISMPNVAKLFKGFNVSKEELEGLGIDKTEIASIIKSVSASGDRATIVIDHSRFAVLSDDITVSLRKNSDGNVVFDIGLSLKGKRVALSAVAKTGDTFEKFDTSKAKNYIDVNGLTDLCKAVNATAEHTSYKISGKAKICGTGIFVLLQREVGVEVKVEVVDGVAYFVITLKRDYKLFNTAIYNDYGGITDIYYDGGDRLTFVRTSYKLGGGKASPVRLNCTMAQFAARPTYYIEYALNFSDMISNSIEDSVKENAQKEAPLGDVIKGFDYANNTFRLNVDLNQIDDNLGALTANVKTNAKREFSSLDGTFYLLSGLFEIDFDFGLTLGVYTRADSLVKNNL